MSNASTAFVLQEQPQTGVVRLVMNRPDSFNALSSDMLSALEEALVQASESPDCRVIVLAALGKAYCAGHDLHEMRSQPDHVFYTQLFAQCSRMMLRIQQLPQPVIAQVQGIATAANWWPCVIWLSLQTPPSSRCRASTMVCFALRPVSD